jgi:hypothetical protein
MKIIDIPEPVMLKAHDDTGKEVGIKFPFAMFAEQALDQYEPLGQGAKNARQAFKIHGILEGISGQKPVPFEDADFDVLKAAVEKAKWKPAAARQCVSYFEAIEKAQDVPASDKK